MTLTACGGAESAKPEATSPSASPSAAPAEIAAFSVTRGKVTGPDRLESRLGEQVVFTVTSDVADEVHVHTYDVTLDVKPGRAATVQVSADIPGTFEVELETSKIVLTRLRVVP